MGKLNTAQALREYIDLSASIIEPCIEDIYISKRILTDEGHSPDEVDDFISERISHYDGYYQGLDEDAYNECVVKEKERVLANLAKLIEERIAIDPDHLPDSDEISIENIRKISKNIRQIMFMKRGMENMGVDAGDIAFAIMDYAKECDERFAVMPEDELDQLMFNRMLESLLGERLDEKIDPETAA